MRKYIVICYNEMFLIVLSYVNFGRYGISPTSFAKILTRNDKVNAFAIFIGSLGNQADILTQKLPAGKGFVCLETRKLPEILKAIFTSTMHCRERTKHIIKYHGNFMHMPWNAFQFCNVYAQT